MKLKRNEFDGNRVFFIGNGPSLSETPLDLLGSEYSFAVNKIYKRFTNTSWRPDIYMNIQSSERLSQWDDKEEAINSINEMVANETHCLLYSDLKKFIGDHPKISYLERSDLDSTMFDEIENSAIKDLDIQLLYEFWSDDIERLVYAYHSAYVMYQIVSYLGFDEIILIGCDLGFKYINPHMVFEDGLDPYRFNGNKQEYIKNAMDQNVLMKSLVNAIMMKLIQSISLSCLDMKIINQFIDRISPTESSHFVENYWDRGLHIKDNIKLEKQILKEHSVAKRICSHKGIDIYNGTVGGHLELFPRVDIRDVVKSSLGEYDDSINMGGYL